MRGAYIASSPLTVNPNVGTWSKLIHNIDPLLALLSCNILLASILDGLSSTRVRYAQVSHSGCMQSSRASLRELPPPSPLCSWWLRPAHYTARHSPARAWTPSVMSSRLVTVDRLRGGNFPLVLGCTVSGSALHHCGCTTTMNHLNAQKGLGVPV